MHPATAQPRYLRVPGDERRLAQELLLRHGPEVPPGQVLRRGAGLQVVLPPQPPQPQQLAVTPQRVPAEADGQRRGVGALGVRQHLGVLEQAVRRQLLQPVGGHAPVHLQLAKWDATVLVHGIQDLKENNKNNNSVPTRAKQLVEFCL